MQNYTSVILCASSVELCVIISLSATEKTQSGTEKKVSLVFYF